MKKTELSIMRTQCAGLLAFAANAQANLRRLSPDDRAALDAEFKARKGGAAYGLADTLRVVNKAASYKDHLIRFWPRFNKALALHQQIRHQI